MDWPGTPYVCQVDKTLRIEYLSSHSIRCHKFSLSTCQHVRTKETNDFDEFHRVPFGAVCDFGQSRPVLIFDTVDAR
jgi:hypothetical protein